ncbi:MAG: UvrD-helicase domain-containing protein [Bacteroidales bacterium]|nr:UvrD-helicase domain-containing protein [Bacteroidales bacterium]
MEELIKTLNESQQAAVKQTEGPVMVIAGAGSGKTRVLTHRVAYMISKGIDPFHILALTFTNKAAREMQGRITKMIGGSHAKSVWMGTFHSIFARILRADGRHLGYPSNYTIYDMDDAKRLVRSIVKEMNLDPKTYTPGHVLHRISAAKSNLISHEQYNGNAELMNQDKMAGKPYIGDIYKRYNLRLKKSSAMDFDDLLFNMNLLLRDFPEVLYKYQQRFQYIMVDEYQDTNFAQYLIVKKLAANNENICVVGDDAQSIYAFRGANIENILNFKSDYPDLKTFKLEQNYRSSQNIVNAANSIIVNNKDQLQKTVWTDNMEGEKIHLIQTSTDQEEGMQIVSMIFETMQNEKAKHSDFAVLYRTNAQSRAIEEALRNKNIPYRIYGGLSFYQRKEVKDLLAYFRLVINSHDQEALTRIINVPARGIGNTTMERLIVEADNTGRSVWQVCENIMESQAKLNAGVRNRIDNFVTMIQSFKTELKKKNAYELAKRIARESGIMKLLKDDETPEGISRYENIQELLNAISLYVDKEDDDVPGGILSTPDETEPELRSLDKYMENIALLTDADQQDDQQERVSLMTIHGAKGLEFPYVFIAGLEENLFPSMQSMGTRAELEEERRLFYVAVTRAEKQVWLSYAETRRRFGNVIFSEPSRFIDELDEQFIFKPQEPGFGSWKSGNGFGKTNMQPPAGQKFPPKRKQISKKQPDTGPSAPPSNIDDIVAGAMVEHTKFGQGKVISVEDSGPNKKATVHFSTVGRKQLLLRFARLRLI